MNGFHPAIAAALVAQHHHDLLRSAADARLVSDSTDTPDRARHTTPLQRPAWWTRVTAPLQVVRAAHAAV
jgi:hypothetical protein